MGLSSMFFLCLLNLIVFFLSHSLWAPTVEKRRSSKKSFFYKNKDLVKVFNLMPPWKPEFRKSMNKQNKGFILISRFNIVELYSIHTYKLNIDITPFWVLPILELKLLLRNWIFSTNSDFIIPIFYPLMV